MIFKFSSELNGGLSFFFRRLTLIIIWWWSSNIILMTSKQTFSLNFFFSSEFCLSLQENLSFWFSFCSATFRVVGFEVHTKRWESYCMEIKINEHKSSRDVRCSPLPWELGTCPISISFFGHMALRTNNCYNLVGLIRISLFNFW